ncbi:ABC transporter substrate-binding protein [Reyranella sp.]|uniref:ABC transporter substrate-binding protein n=1 Tax=Reyranella sp. TaxID=1929291 RepID=UPI003BA915F6
MIFNRLGVGPLAALAASLWAAAPVSAQDCKVKVADSLLVKPGTLVMSINPTLPPVQWVDEKGQLRGLHVELGEAIARKLCLKAEHVRVEFSVMVPGVQSGRWDMINTGMFFTEDRAKIMQLVRYGYDGISISAQAGNPLKIAKPEDLAGRSVSVELGGAPERRARELSKTLEEKGLKPVTIRTFENFAAAYQALRAGQVEAAVSVDAVARLYGEKGDFAEAITGLYPTVIAFGLSKKQLAEYVAGALQELKAEGTYQKMFTAYGRKLYEEPFDVKGP